MTKYRLNKYVRVSDNKDYIYLYNFMRGTMLILYEPEDIEKYKKQEIDSEDIFWKRIIDGEYYIEQNKNEEKLLDFLYDRLVINSRTLEITMIPSEQCNFRCEYCYEGYDSKIIDPEILEGSIHMIDNMATKNRYDKVLISWFGGEPTLHEKMVCDFMNRLGKLLQGRAQVVGAMTTNAYLLTPDVFMRYYNSGVRSYQITVDGFADTHDKLRKLRTGGATWNVIMNNLDNIYKMQLDELYISLRINYNEEVVENIFDFLDHIKERFGNTFRIHLHPISQMSRDEKECICDPVFSDIAKEILMQYVVDNEIYSDVPFMNCSLFGSVCYASKPDQYIIDAYGKLRKCTVSLNDDNNLIGKITGKDTYEINQYKVAEWVYGAEMSSNCGDCCLRPVCYGKGCPQKAVVGIESRCSVNKSAIFTYLDHLADKKIKELTCVRI